MKDKINPDHYKKGEIECIDAMVAAYGEEEVRIYSKLAAFKYGWRRGDKDEEAQEVGKQKWYLDRSIGIDPRKNNGKEEGMGESVSIEYTESDNPLESSHRWHETYYQERGV